MFAAFLALLLLPAAADISLVQVVQSQSHQGEDGLFGKTWMLVSGRKMRLVSGFARKVPTSDKRWSEEPARLIQILDLDTTSLLLIDPPSRTYEERPLWDIRYGDSLHETLSGGPRLYTVDAASVTLEPGSLVRRCLGEAPCEHYHVHASFELRDEAKGLVRAKLSQDLWVAPVLGKLQPKFLELIAFQNAYKAAGGGRFSPLDYETFQLREAAAYLRVRPGDLERVVEKVKAACAEIPGYPLTSSVTWWRDPRDPEPPSPPKARPPRARPPAPAPPPEPPRHWPTGPRFRPIGWSRTWNRIDGEFQRMGLRFGQFPLGRIDHGTNLRPMRYADFQKQLRIVMRESLPSHAEEEAPARAPEPPRRRSKRKGMPFYEVFAEIADIDPAPVAPPSFFRPPDGYTRAGKRK